MKNETNNLVNKFFHEIDIEINHACNRTCSYCPNSLTQRAEQGEMSVELFAKILHQLKQINYLGKICFHFYNEPLLCSKLELFVEMAKKQLPASKLELVTNGTLLTEEKFLRLADLGVYLFTITKHEGVESIPLDKSLTSMDAELKSKLKIMDYTQLYYSNRGGLVPEISRDKKLPLLRPCFIPSCMVVVTVKGNILGCYEDYNQESTMGNIQEKHIKEIWESDKFSNFRQDLKLGRREKYPLCRKCDNIKLIQ